MAGGAHRAVWPAVQSEAQGRGISDDNDVPVYDFTANTSAGASFRVYCRTSCSQPWKRYSLLPALLPHCVIAYVTAGRSANPVDEKEAAQLELAQSTKMPTLVPWWVMQTCFHVLV